MQCDLKIYLIKLILVSFSVMPPREIWYGQNTQTTFDDKLKPRETFSSENTGNKKAATADFESNVNLSRVNKTFISFTNRIFCYLSIIIFLLFFFFSGDFIQKYGKS